MILIFLLSGFGIRTASLLDSLRCLAETQRTVTVSRMIPVLLLALLTGPLATGPLKIAVNSTTIESFPVFAAAAGMSANGEGSRIELVPVPNGRAAMSELVSGTADLATGSETQALLNSLTEPRLRIILTLAECRYRIIARRSAGIRRISDLRGKKVAVTANTSSHYFLHRMLLSAHVDEAGIQLVALEGRDMPAALENRTVDAVSIWEPHAENSLRELGSDAVVFEDASAYTERFNLNTRTDVLEDPEKRAALLAFVRAISRSSAALRKRPPDLISSLSPRVGIPDQIVMVVWPQFSFPASISEGLRAVLGEVEPWVAAAQKRSPRARDDLAVLVDPSVVEQALR
jgi:NitT/TauT family transport system substrate-binding protein